MFEVPLGKVAGVLKSDDSVIVNDVRNISLDWLPIFEY